MRTAVPSGLAVPEPLDVAVGSAEDRAAELRSASIGHLLGFETEVPHPARGSVRPESLRLSAAPSPTCAGSPGHWIVEAWFDWFRGIH
jgi:hypothetical protein